MKISDSDTIAAISSAVVNSGISIIRISGEDAFKIADKIFKGKKKVADMESHTVAYGKIKNLKSDEIIDEVLLLKFDAPKTYTKENTVEINCHGGVNITNRVFDTVIKAGARIAEAGEFTKRAFLNGRIDLSQAEAVMDLINSYTDQASKVAVKHLEGKFSNSVNDIKEILVDVCAEIEFNIEYNEQEIKSGVIQSFIKKLTECKNKINNILKTYDTGKILREGVNIVIAGRPNVGKSSLLNEILGNNRAIVTDIPGTTRDVIEEYVNINGITANISDCAGIRQTDNVIEKIGIEKSFEAVKNADLIVYMIDVLKNLSSEDTEFIEKYSDKNIIVILNKIDLVEDKTLNRKYDMIKEKTNLDPIVVSLKEKQGVDDFYDRFKQMYDFGNIDINNDNIVTNARHKNSLKSAKKNIQEAIDSLNEKIPVDLVTIDINQGIYDLGIITGETATDDIIERVFSNFCVGK